MGESSIAGSRAGESSVPHSAEMGSVNSKWTEEEKKEGGGDVKQFG